MPAWLIALLVKMALSFGLPWLEKRFPALAPIIEEILKVIGGAPTSAELHSAVQHYEKACSGVGCPPDLKRE